MARFEGICQKPFGPETVRCIALRKPWLRRVGTHCGMCSGLLILWAANSNSAFLTSDSYLLGHIILQGRYTHYGLIMPLLLNMTVLVNILHYNVLLMILELQTRMDFGILYQTHFHETLTAVQLLEMQLDVT